LAANAMTKASNFVLNAGLNGRRSALETAYLVSYVDKLIGQALPFNSRAGIYMPRFNPQAIFLNPFSCKESQ
jgi:hypothetical protein